MVNTAASIQTRVNTDEFLRKIKLHDLAPAEILNMINTRPAAAVELFPVSIKILFEFFIYLTVEYSARSYLSSVLLLVLLTLSAMCFLCYLSLALNYWV